MGAAGDLLALKDISFAVEPGDRIGIIGRNGAGKSTLLKIISRITAPSEGRIVIRGRVGSLLEVGTGFHPELTGRENIYLNGAILGMHRTEIKSKFDPIVEFAEIEKFLDLPVKRYSSGMYVRLAFAVAAHLQTEILLVDEVLAVGDIAFQKKCLGKMKDISDAGRTILFVSHNLSAVRQLCTKGIYLENGALKAIGPIGAITQNYLDDCGGQMQSRVRFPVHHERPAIKCIEFLGQRDVPVYEHQEEVKIRVVFYLPEDMPRLQINLSIWADGQKLFMLLGTQGAQRGFGQIESFKAGTHQITFALSPGQLLKGKYTVRTALIEPQQKVHDAKIDLLSFEIFDQTSVYSRQQIDNPGKIVIDSSYDYAYNP
jgi:lipopolysaccharide transport system ATP-binding protein